MLFKMVLKLHHALLSKIAIRLLYFNTSVFNYKFAMLSQEMFFVKGVDCCNYSPAV